MPSIFKNIRRKLASENKTAAYLRYALGEIILVVIGILIALQVNNWNEARKEKNNEIKLAEQLLSDAKADSVFFESRLSFQQNRDTLFSSLIQVSNGVLQDSLLNLKVTNTPFFIRLAYQSNLINNDPNAYDHISQGNIKNKLRAYYKAYDYVVNAIELNNRICEKYGTPLQIKYYEQIQTLPKTPHIKDYMFALKDRKTIAQFDLFKFYGTIYGTQCQKFLKVNHELILLLKTYLKAHK